MTAVGDRVMFEGWGEPDPYSSLKPGTEGTVTLIDDGGTVHVAWDSGQTLGLLTKRAPWMPHNAPFKHDRFRVL